MRVRRNLFAMFVFVTFMWGVPVFAHAGTIWRSAPTHPHSVLLHTSDLYRYNFYNGISPSSSIRIGTWNQPDFATTASTSVHIWARWNGSWSPYLGIGLSMTAGGDPFAAFLPANTTAQLFGALPSRPTFSLMANATSALQEYILPVNQGATIRQGNEVWTAFYSFSELGSTYWLGSQGTMPYIELCEGACDPPLPDPCAAPGACASNVLFLPGIEASRLYCSNEDSSERKLWEPGRNDTLLDLQLNSNGISIRDDIYVKAGDVIDEVPVTGANIYKSFIAKMNELRDTQRVINEWEAIPYDWRLSIGQIFMRSRQMGSHISYTDTDFINYWKPPYIVQELKRLATTSKTGKVTIVAHSNGGLLAKKLTDMLRTDAHLIIDKIIFVAVPQAGTPAAIAAALHGYGQNIGLGPIVYVSSASARNFASTSPMAYTLLPSARYFTQVDDPVVSFDASLPDWINRYGATIHSQETLRTFLTDTFGRVNAQTGDTDQPIWLNSRLLGDAEQFHNYFDYWAPHSGVQLVQIAGWGVPTTVTGITYKKKDSGVRPEPSFTIDGDGTVVVPSALWTSTTTGATNYWVDLQKYNTRITNNLAFGLLSIKHANVLEIPKLLDFLSDQITNTTKLLSDYNYLFTESPPANNLRLRYALHSPLTLNLYDSQGRHTGVSTTTGLVEEQVPGTYYTEFGDVKYLFSDSSTSSRIIMNGYAPGTFTLDIDQYSGNTTTASTTFKDIPTTANTTVSLAVQSDLTTLTPMQLDQNGDGTIDATIAPKLGGTATLDITPPEIRVTFSTSTKAFSFVGSDDIGTATVTATTTYPVLKRGQREYRGIATTTVIARDEAGNTTTLIYSEQLPSPSLARTIVPRTVAYNGATTTIVASEVTYKWRVNTNNTVIQFAAHLRTPSAALESTYGPQKSTVIMSKPRKLDTSDANEGLNLRPVRRALPGMVIPYVVTKRGSLIAGY